MKKHLNILSIALLLPLAMQAQTSVNAQDNKPTPKIAVYATGNVSEGHRLYMANAVEHALIQGGNVEVLPRQSAVLDQLAKERGYQKSGNVSDLNIAKLGGELGANIICVVEVNDFLGLEINARSISVEQNRAVRSARTDMVDDLNNKDQLRKAAQDIVNQLMGNQRISDSDIAKLGRESSSSGAKRNGASYNPDGIELVYVEGSDSGIMATKGFYIGKYEVTQAQWRAIMGGNPSNWKGDNLPVENVSWNDAQEFLNKLNAVTGRNYRLPTENEWAYAASGGTANKFCPGGCEYSGSNSIDNVAWYYGNSGQRTHPVGTKAANELGIHDMSGNVWEWCQDWYDSSQTFRVLRGGSWYSNASYCRVAYRDFNTPGNRNSFDGLRVLLP